MHHRKRKVNVFHGRGSTLGKMQRNDLRMEVHLSVLVVALSSSSLLVAVVIFVGITLLLPREL